jgi:hypothetical protein
MHALRPSSDNQCGYPYYSPLDSPDIYSVHYNCNNNYYIIIIIIIIIIWKM